jgi:hypothetical protein
VLVLAGLLGCATTPAAPYLVTGSEWTKGRVRQLSLVGVDGRAIHPARAGGAELSPGRHDVDIRVEWSNANADVTQLQFEAEPQVRYVALAYELTAGEARENARVRPFTYPESLWRGLAEGAATGAAPLWVPVVLIYRGVRKVYGASAPATRPYEGCCFVWIQEEAGSALVAGERP